MLVILGCVIFRGTFYELWNLRITGFLHHMHDYDNNFHQICGMMTLNFRDFAKLPMCYFMQNVTYL